MVLNRLSTASDGQCKQAKKIDCAGREEEKYKEGKRVKREKGL
jgi:hypothetical protein